MIHVTSTVTRVFGLCLLLATVSFANSETKDSPEKVKLNESRLVAQEPLLSISGFAECWEEVGNGGWKVTCLMTEGRCIITYDSDWKHVVIDPDDVGVGRREYTSCVAPPTQSGSGIKSDGTPYVDYEIVIGN